VEGERREERVRVRELRVSRRQAAISEVEMQQVHRSRGRTDGWSTFESEPPRRHATGERRIGRKL